MKFYVGNLPFKAESDTLKELFGKHATVADVNIITDNNGRSKGFAFVTVKEKDKGDEIIKALNGSEVLGRKIRVDVSQKKTGGQSNSKPKKSSRELRAMREEARCAAVVDDDMRRLMAKDTAIGRAEAGERDAVCRRAGRDPQRLHIGVEQSGKGAVQPRAPGVAIIAMIGLVGGGDRGEKFGADRRGVVGKEMHGIAIAGRSPRGKRPAARCWLYSPSIGQHR